MRTLSRDVNLRQNTEEQIQNHRKQQILGEFKAHFNIVRV